MVSGKPKPLYDNIGIGYDATRRPDPFLYGAKRQPEMYLSPAIRQGISTFSSLADPREVAGGRIRLRSDIASARIDENMEQYRHDGRDYLFVVSSKGI